MIIEQHGADDAAMQHDFMRVISGDDYICLNMDTSYNILDTHSSDMDWDVVSHYKPMT